MEVTARGQSLVVRPQSDEERDCLRAIYDSAQRGIPQTWPKIDCAPRMQLQIRTQYDTGLPAGLGGL